MEIDITAFMTQFGDRLEMFASSRYESGLDNIGDITARNSLKMQHFFAHVDSEAIRDYLASFGAWSDLDSWSPRYLRAMLIQFVASAARAADDAGDAGEDARVYQVGNRWFFTMDM